MIVLKTYLLQKLGILLCLLLMAYGSVKLSATSEHVIIKEDEERLIVPALNNTDAVKYGSQMDSVEVNTSKMWRFESNSLAGK